MPSAAPFDLRLLVRQFPCLAVVRGNPHPIAPHVRHPGRGVRESDTTMDGCRVFEAIASSGECVHREKLVPGVDEEILREWLWGILERVDPKMRLA